jgi:hypothetical protein
MLQQLAQIGQRAIAPPKGNARLTAAQEQPPIFSDEVGFSHQPVE